MYKFHRHQIFAKVHVYNVHVVILTLSSSSSFSLLVFGGWVCMGGSLVLFLLVLFACVFFSTCLVFAVSLLNVSEVL